MTSNLEMKRENDFTDFSSFIPHFSLFCSFNVQLRGTHCRNKIILLFISFSNLPLLMWIESLLPALVHFMFLGQGWWVGTEWACFEILNHYQSVLWLNLKNKWKLVKIRIQPLAKKSCRTEHNQATFPKHFFCVANLWVFIV